ncbi:MAG: hypothetical protein QOG91_198 [Candidatus Parcubacteria bacterium]|jgi:peptidoglycan hydrolase-like protein with peptidoglycan-binding domain|nr:hypothetical protein [Candidatus Parcubacteria bacterium]
MSKKSQYYASATAVLVLVSVIGILPSKSRADTASVSDIAPASTSVAATTSCPLITSFMKSGRQNDTAQVSKLQAFLRDREELDVDVTGVFDQKTEDAVKDFQSHYLDSVLGPWGASQPSGEVYITTQKKINELACAQPMTLDEHELSVLNAFKQNRATVMAGSGGQVTVETVPGPTVQLVAPNPSESPIASESPSVSNGPTSANDNIKIADNADKNAQANSGGSPDAAAAGSPSILSRFWSFIVNLFR